VLSGTAMASTLEKPQRFAREYKQLADPVLRAHQLAMVVRDLEDAVGYGIFTMRFWFRWIEDWHEAVSESSARYSEEAHRSIDSIERLLLEVGEGVISLIDKAATLHFDVERAGEFKELYATLKSCAAAIDPEFQRTTLREHFRKAHDDYKNNSLETVDNAWSTD
jgi:hypothetical protein